MFPSPSTLSGLGVGPKLRAPGFGALNLSPEPAMPDRVYRVSRAYRVYRL